jgi:hypothetical protein
MARIVRDLEYRFDIDGRVYLVQVCSPDAHSAAPVTRSAGQFDIMIMTAPADTLASFQRGDPAVMADHVIHDVSARMPTLPRAEIETFRDAVIAWIGEHRQAAANR